MLCPVCQADLPPNTPRCPKDGTQIELDLERSTIPFEKAASFSWLEKLREQEDLKDSDTQLRPTSPPKGVPLLDESTVVSFLEASLPEPSKGQSWPAPKEGELSGRQDSFARAVKAHLEAHPPTPPIPQTETLALSEPKVIPAEKKADLTIEVETVAFPENKTVLSPPEAPRAPASPEPVLTQSPTFLVPPKREPSNIEYAEVPDSKKTNFLSPEAKAEMKALRLVPPLDLGPLQDTSPETRAMLVEKGSQGLSLDINIKPGIQLGGYILESYISAGGMGEIWLGTQPKISKKVAIKILQEGFSQNQEVVARFLQEARAVNEIKHRNIVDIYDFGETPDGRPYFVMEYLEGRNMGDYLQEHGPLPYSEIVSIFSQLCRGLQAAHDRGIVHRDLKPDNIFLLQEEGQEPFVKILDFGVAKLMTQDAKNITRHGTIIGTPAYMAPEQCKGSKQVDHRADIYSLGILLFEMLTGRTPFEDPNEGHGSTLVKQVSMTPPSPSSVAKNREISEEMDQFVAQLLSKDPETRPNRCADLPGELVSILGEKQKETWAQLKGSVILASVVDASQPPEKKEYAITAKRKALPKPQAPPPRSSWGLHAVAGMGILISGVVLGMVLASSTKPLAAPAVVQPVSTPAAASKPTPASVPAPAPVKPKPTPPPPPKPAASSQVAPVEPPKKKAEPPPPVLTEKAYRAMVEKSFKEIKFTSCRSFGTGKVPAIFTLDGKGKVVKIKTDSSKRGACVAKIIKKEKFPASTKTYKFTFSVYVK